MSSLLQKVVAQTNGPLRTLVSSSGTKLARTSSLVVKKNNNNEASNSRRRLSTTSLSSNNDRFDLVLAKHFFYLKNVILFFSYASFLINFGI